MTGKPTKFPEWATTLTANPTSGQNNRVEPSAGVKDLGFDYLEIPPRQYTNYQLWLINQWLEHLDGSLNQFAPHEAAAPDMTVIIDAGRVFDGVTHTAKAQQITTTIIAPVTNPRIDRIAIDKATGNYAIIPGAEAASPTAPAYSANHYPVCQIALTTSTTQITNSLITDERALIQPPSVALTTTISGAAASSITVSGLDSTYIGGYIIDGYLSTAGAESMVLELNGDITATNYYSNRSDFSAAYSRTTANNSALFNIENGDKIPFNYRLIQNSSDGEAYLIGHSGEAGATASNVLTTVKYTITDNITSIGFSTGAAYINVGSYLRVRRMV